jgi:hypothetical protein
MVLPKRMTAYKITARPTERSSSARPALDSRPAIVLLCIAYTTAFILVYTRVIVPVWGYEGFHAQALPRHVALGWALAILPSLWMPIRLIRPSVLVYWLLYLLVIVPVCLVPVYSLAHQSSGLLWLAASIVAMFAVTGIIYRVPLLRLPNMQLRTHEFAVMLLLLSAVFYALLILTFGFHISYVSLEDIYVIRTEFQETLEQGSPIVAYAIGWQAYVINPLLMACGLTNRKMSWVVASVAGQFLIYSISGFRTVYFSVVVLPYLLWTMKGKKPFAIKLTFTWLALFLLAGALQLLGWSQSLAAFLGERMTAIPGLLTGYYYEFFSSHPKALLGHSIFKSFVHYPYAVEPRRIIGYIYFHDVGMSANANLWADAYANFGYAGIVCFTLLLALVLWVFDSMAAERDPRVGALAIALPAFALANAGLLTTLLTHGIALTMLLLYLMPPAFDPRTALAETEPAMELQS